MTETTQRRSWAEVLRPYAHPSLGRSLFQLLNSAIPFVLMWVLMLASLEYSY